MELGSRVAGFSTPNGLRPLMCLDDMSDFAGDGATAPKLFIRLKTPVENAEVDGALPCGTRANVVASVWATRLAVVRCPTMEPSSDSTDRSFGEPSQRGKGESG